MIRERDIRSFACNYHRNGVGGDGFYACSFYWREGRATRAMLAVVWDAPGVVSVLSGNINERWRGDLFEPHLRRLIAKSQVPA